MVNKKPKISQAGKDTFYANYAARTKKAGKTPIPKNAFDWGSVGAHNVSYYNKIDSGKISGYKDTKALKGRNTSKAHVNRILNFLKKKGSKTLKGM